MTEHPAPQPLAPAESFNTPEAAATEYKRYAASPEYLQASSSPHGKEPALARLTALAKAAWPTPGVQASPAPGTPQEARAAAEQHHDALTRLGDGAELSEVELQDMAAAFAPRSADDFLNSVPNSPDFPFADEWRQQFFNDQISPSVANLIMNAPHMAEQAAAMSDDDYYGAVDKAAAELRALPGGRTMLRKAIDMVDALPDGHPYIPIAEALLTRSGGILEIAHWSDRLRGRAAH